MKKFTFLLLLTLGFAISKTQAQDSTAIIPDPWEKLYGYWYFEGVDSSDQWSRGQPPIVHKLYFSKDSMMASNFGSRAISAMGSTWNCDVGTWRVVGDTINFTNTRTITFSTNTGQYYYSNRRFLMPDYTLVVKKVTPEELVVDRILSRMEVRVSIELSNKQYFVIDRRVYKRVPTQVMK